MIFRPASLLLCLMLTPTVSTAQADFQRYGKPVEPAPADPAILKALATIDSSRIEQMIKTLVGFGTRNTLTSMDTSLPPGQGINAAADWIAAQFAEISQACGGCIEVKRDTFTADPASGESWARRIPSPTRLTNIYAILRGSDPARAKSMYLVTGHYDSINSHVFKNWADTSGIAPGANDDASGVAVSLECARALSSLHLPATLVFVAVAGEEQGLVGSAHLAHLAREEDWQLQGVLNNDIVGGNTTPGDMLQLKDRVRVFSEGVPMAATPDQARRIRGLGEENDSSSRQLARAISETARTYFGSSSDAPFNAFLVDRPDRYGRGGDHTSFNREGFAAVRFTEWREDFNHQHQNVRTENGVEYGDLLKYVDFDYVARVARLNAATMAVLASAPPPPEKVRVVTRNLDNGTTLRWVDGPGAPSGTAYEIVWRETAAPTWQRFAPAGSDRKGSDGEYSVTVPVSKDNAIFGVRAVDGAGHRSVAVAPTPER